MATVAKQTMTVDEFYDWANRPENADRTWELVDGEPIEMPSPGTQHCGLIMWLGCLLNLYIDARGSGFVGGADGGVIVRPRTATTRGPDATVYLNPPKRLASNPRYSEAVPDLVIEVLSPHDRHGETMERIADYWRMGVGIIWVIDPEDLLVTVHRRTEIPTSFTQDETLEGEWSLPGLTLPLSRLFQKILAARQPDDGTL